MPMNNRKLVPQKLPLLLDYAPGAAAAYSLRALSNSYVGPVVTVRRSTDSAEADFTADEIDDGTLAAWCSGGDGFVRKWWDQSGNAGRDATQATAANQPQIVDAGALVTEGGKAAIELDGVDDFLAANISGFQNIQNLTAAVVFSTPVAAQADTNTGIFWTFGSSVAEYLILSSATSVFGGEYIAVNFNNPTSRRLGSTTYRRNANESSIMFSTHLQTGTKLFSVGSEVSLDLASGMTTTTPAAPADTGYTADDTVWFGVVNSSGTPVAHVQQKYQELIFYPTDMTALRTRIEADMAWYY